MTYHPVSHLKEFQRGLLINPEVPLLVMSSIMHCHSEAELKIVWDKILAERLLKNPEAIQALAKKNQIYLALPKKQTLVDKLLGK